MEKNEKYEELINDILYLFGAKIVQLCGSEKDFRKGGLVTLDRKAFLTLDDIDFNKFIEANLFVYNCLRDHERYIYKNLADEKISKYENIKYFSIFVEKEGAGADIEYIKSYFKKD